VKRSETRGRLLPQARRYEPAIAAAGWGRIRALGVVFWFALGAAVSGYVWHASLPREGLRAYEHLPATFSPFAGVSAPALAAKGLFGIGGALLILLLPWFAATAGTLLRDAVLASFGRSELGRVEVVTGGGRPEREVYYAFVTPGGSLVRGRADLAATPPDEPAARNAAEVAPGETLAVTYLPFVPQVSQPSDALLFEPRA